jgi:hypothetical protein
MVARTEIGGAIIATLLFYGLVKRRGIGIQEGPRAFTRGFDSHTRCQQFTKGIYEKVTRRFW